MNYFNVKFDGCDAEVEPVFIVWTLNRCIHSVKCTGGVGKMWYFIWFLMGHYTKVLHECYFYINNLEFTINYVHNKKVMFDQSEQYLNERV